MQDEVLFYTLATSQWEDLANTLIKRIMIDLRFDWKNNMELYGLGGGFVEKTTLRNHIIRTLSKGVTHNKIINKLIKVRTRHISLFYC